MSKSCTQPTLEPLKALKTIEKTTRIGVLCGGLSSEREVSLRSGKNCHEALKRLGYTNVVQIDVDRKIAHVLDAENIEVVFLALHGRYGEDGAIQGLLEIEGIPYTGNRLTTSALAMNKELTKKILADAGLPILPSVTLTFSKNNQRALAGVAYQSTYPVMVKPINEGSSVGMAKVNSPSELDVAVENASKYSRSVMIEQYIPGKSITVGVIDIDGEPTVTPILELRTRNEWYDEKSKYTQGLTEFILPAELSDEVTRQIQAVTLKAHTVLECHGISRVDYVVDAESRFYILEINTIPGMTDLSDLPAQAKAMGIGYDELVEYILQTALY